MMISRKQFKLLSILQKEVESAVLDGYILISNEDYNESHMFIRRLLHRNNGNTFNIIADADVSKISFYKNHKLVKTTKL